MGDAAHGGGRPDGKSTAAGDFAVRDADPPKRRASDLAARGEFQCAGVDDGSGVRRFFGEQGGSVVAHLRDDDFGGDPSEPRVRQNVL